MVANLTNNKDVFMCILRFQTVGQHCPSSSSAATCSLRAEESQRTAAAAAEDGRRGSNLNEYEVNTWLWMFGRGKPRLGGLTIE